VARGQAEIEAESIAYIVTTHAGMNVDTYTVPYVASWADGDTTRVRDCFATVAKCARSIVPEPNPATASPAHSRSLLGTLTATAGLLAIPNLEDVSGRHPAP